MQGSLINSINKEVNIKSRSQFILIITLLLIFNQCDANSFSATQIKVSPNHAKSVNSKYTFSFSAISAFSSNFKLKIFYPNQFSLTSPTGCALLINNAAINSVTCSLSLSNQIILDNINNVNTVGSLSISFNSTTARYSGPFTLTVSFFDPITDTVYFGETYYVTISIINAVMTCSLSSNETRTGATSIYTIQYVPTVEISQSSTIQIQIQPWGPYFRSNFVTTSTTSICSDLCTLTLPSSNANSYQLVKYSTLYPTVGSSAPKTLILNSARNPPSLQPMTFSILVLANISTFSQREYMTCSGSFSSSEISSFSSINFATTNKAISQNNIMTLMISLKNPISSISYLRINPSGLSLSYQFNQYNQPTRPAQFATTDGSLLLGNLTQSTSSSPTLILLNNFTLQNPPYGNKPVLVSFKTERLVDTVYYGIQTGTVQIIATPSTITSSAVQAATFALNTLTTYTLWFITKNRLINTSFIRITFPSSIKLSTGTASTCTLSGVASTCSVTSGSLLNISINTIITASNLSVIITSVKNPATTTTTQSIQISSFYEGQQSVVDQLTTGLTATATEVPLNSAKINSSSLKVGMTSNYTLTIQIRNGLPASSSLKIKIPTNSFPTSNLILRQLSVIKPPAVSATVYSGCTLITISPMYIEVPTSCFSEQLPALTTIILIIGNTTNPQSTKPTSSWQVETFYNNKIMEYLMTGITIQMTETVVINNFVVVPANNTVNQINVYTFEITFLYNHYNGDRAIITFPDGIIIGAGFQCNAITSQVTISCFQSNSVIMEVIFTSSDGTQATYSSLKFSVTSITNNWFSGTRSFSLQTTTNDTSYYYVQSGTAVVNLVSSKFPVVAANNQKIILLGTSKIELGLTSPFPLTKISDTTLLRVTIIVPTNLTPLQNTCTSSYPSSSCTLSAQTITLTQIANFPTTITLTFDASTTYFQNTSPFSVKLFYNNIQVASNTQLLVSRYCVNPCKQCTSNSSQCLSCLPQPHASNNTLLPFNSTCVISCPTTFFLNPDSLQCAQCNSTACLQCEVTSNTCTVCKTNKYLHQKACVSVCPSTFYAANGQCLGCSTPCKTCSSLTICQTCINNYFLDLDGKCVLTCTQTGYLGIDGTCQKCLNNCVTCSITLSNCTSCDSPNYLLMSNQCVRACTPGFYNNVNSTCLACVSPCNTCSSSTNCDSCVSTYFLYDDSTCTKTCPSGTLPKINVCELCSSECASCEGTLSNCTSCPTPLLFYLNQCLTQCPPLTYPYQKTCTTCISPCITCSSSPQLCLSCVSGMYLLNNTCLNQCPTNSYYTDSSTKSCLPCISNCLSCTNTVSCTTCSAEFYVFDGVCVNQCPTSKPIVQNRQCMGCSSECSSCEGTPTNCTACTVFYFKYQYTCVQSCPLAYYSNIVTYQCEDGLSSKIVFFPVLITSLVMVVIVIISKIIAKTTSFPTGTTAILAPMQLAIWIYLLVLLGAPIKQPDVDYVLPIIMCVVALVAFLVTNIIFFKLNSSRIEEDQYLKQWITNSINYYAMKIIGFSSLVLGCKFYRLVYSRLFNSLPLSAAFKTRPNVFTIATVFTIVVLCLCQVPMIIACWALIYTKTLKDQIFYTAIEALIVTIGVAIISLIDIYKAEQFFEETEFFKIKKYIEKVKDSSFNKIQEGFEIENEQGSVDAERFVGLTGGKFMYTKQDPDSLKELYFENEEDRSQETDFNETLTADRLKKNKINKRINIFAPIQQEDAEYYELQKYQQEEAFTQAEKHREKKRMKSHQSDQENQSDQVRERRIQMGIDEPFDDKKSLISDRSRKQRWNNIMTKRKQLSDKIFNRHPINLAKIEDMKEDDDDLDDDIDIDLQQEHNTTGLKRRRRRKKKGSHNKQLEEIYLQRLTDKKKKSAKDMFVSDKSLKYDF